MAAISPFNFLAVLDGKVQAPELISPDLTMPAFEDALASMLGSQAENANGSEDTQTPTAAPTLGLPTGIRLTLDPPLNGVPTGSEADEEAPLLGLTSAEAAVPDESDAEPVEDEALLMNPQACFVTLPWLPAADRESPPALASVPLPGIAFGAAPRAAEPADASEQAAAPSNRASVQGQPADSAQAGEPIRRSTLRFPPPTPEALHQLARELELVPVQGETPARAVEKPALKAIESADLAPAARSFARAAEPGYVVAPSFLEGGRIEWAIEMPTVHANDAHRSMSYAVAAAEHEQRTTRADNARPAAKRERAAVAAPEGNTRREAREPLERSREVEPSLAIMSPAEPLTTANAAEAPVFTLHAQAPRNEAPSEQRISAPVALPDPWRSEGARERRQDDAEITVSQMTLSHRVEARTVVDDLGAITVRAEAHHGQVEVSVSAERVETTAFLDLNRADLSRDLKISAPSVSDVSVRTGDGGSGSRREQHAQRQASEGWAAGTPSSMAAAASDTRATTANGRRVRIVL